MRQTGALGAFAAVIVMGLAATRCLTPVVRLLLTAIWEGRMELITVVDAGPIFGANEREVTSVTLPNISVLTAIADRQEVGPLLALPFSRKPKSASRLSSLIVIG